MVFIVTTGSYFNLPHSPFPLWYNLSRILLATHGRLSPRRDVRMRREKVASVGGDLLGPIMWIGRQHLTKHLFPVGS